MSTMTSVTLLGPQFRSPNLRDVLQTIRLAGPFVSISAGWQEREGELDELRTHVDSEVHDLRIYERSERVFEEDPELRGAHRQRQALLQEQQDLYRLRLQHYKDALRELFEQTDATAALLRRARRQALAALRRLDAQHLMAIATAHQQFEQQYRPADRPAVRAAAERVMRYVDQANAVFIAGGHVAVLLNRLRLLGGATLLRNKPVVAWSAGAMITGDAIALFHDNPPQGQAHVELLENGLALLPRVLALPHAASRLRLDDSARVAVLARRFAPRSCVTLNDGDWLHFENGHLMHGAGSQRLLRCGRLADAMS